MNDERRRAELRRFFAENLKGDRAEFQRLSGLSKGRITQLLQGGENQPFGERAARKLAQKFRLRDDYFEGRRPGDPPQSTLGPEQLELLRLWHPLLEDQRNDLLAQITVAHDAALRVIAEVSRRGLDANVPENVLPEIFTRPAQREIPIEPPKVKQGKKGHK